MLLHAATVEELEEVEVMVEEEVDETGTGTPAHLIVYNDDHNTFEWVIQCFVDVLQHDSAQAEQCALIIHFKGKATVKTAPHRELRPKREALVERGLSAVIETEGKQD